MRHPHALNLNETIQHPGRELRFEISTNLSEQSDVELLGPMTGKLVAVGTGNALLIRGDYEAQVWLECSRCALRFAERISFHAEDEFMLEGTPASLSGKSSAKVVDEEPYPLFDGNALLIDDYLRQHLAINLPMQPLCRVDCNGLCAHCGANLNKSTCDCITVVGHPAFEALADQWKKDD